MTLPSDCMVRRLMKDISNRSNRTDRTIILNHIAAFWDSYRATVRNASMDAPLAFSAISSSAKIRVRPNY